MEARAKSRRMFHVKHRSEETREAEEAARERQARAGREGARGRRGGAGGRRARGRATARRGRLGRGAEQSARRDVGSREDRLGRSTVRGENKVDSNRARDASPPGRSRHRGGAGRPAGRERIPRVFHVKHSHTRARTRLERQLEAETPDRLDVGVGARGAQLVAEVGHVHVDRAVLGGIGLAPHQLEQLLLGEHALRM